MSMALRTQMQIKCCCAAYPPNYACDCQQLKTSFVNGRIKQPRTITFNLNLTSGVCSHYGREEPYSSLPPRLWNDCTAFCDCSHCQGTSGCSCPTFNDPSCCNAWSGDPPTYRDVLRSTTGCFVWANNDADCRFKGWDHVNYGLCHGGWVQDWFTDEWYWQGPPETATWCQDVIDDPFQLCKTGTEVMKEYEIFTSPVAQAFDGDVHLREINEIDPKGVYVPDEDYYGDWLHESGGGSDSLEWGESPKVPYHVKSITPLGAGGYNFYIWNDGSSDISAVYLWHKPPSGWTCGDAFPTDDFVETFLIDVVGGSKHGRYEIPTSGKTIKDLDVSLGAIDSALHVLCVNTLRTTPIDKFKFTGPESGQDPPGQSHGMNNRGCVYHNEERCWGQPPEFPPVGCGFEDDQYTTNEYVAVVTEVWPSGEAKDNVRLGQSIGYTDFARVRGLDTDDWQGNPNMRHCLIAKSDTSNSVQYGNDLKYNWAEGAVAAYRFDLRCIDSSGDYPHPDGLQFNGRGWYINAQLVALPVDFDSGPTNYSCFGSPTGLGEIHVIGGPSEPGAPYSNDVLVQRFHILTENQGDCGISLLDKSYSEWGGNRLGNEPKHDFDPTGFSKAICADSPPYFHEYESLPRPEIGLYRLSELCDYVEAPGCNVDDGKCNGHIASGAPLLHFHAQLANITVTEEFDYPELSCENTLPRYCR